VSRAAAAAVVRLAAPVAAIVLLAASAAAEPHGTHRADQRVAHIKVALESVRAASSDALDQANEYARVLVRGACASGVQRLKVECLMTAARRYCRNRGEAEARRCQLYMDVIASNVLADEQLISPEKRYQIMRAYKDYRRELAHELRRIQGALAVDFRLRMGEAEDADSMAKNIDQYCLTTADETNLAWQTCVSSLVWFIGK
jgi:hypothetical protein